MKTYNYSVSTNTIWASFDYGQVEANDIEEATKKAIEELKENFKKANESLAHCDNTAGFSLSFNENDVIVTEEKE